MDKTNLIKEAKRFRAAIEKARDAGAFEPKDFNRERMSEFPYECCDDTADLFTHYLFHEFGTDSIRIDGHFYSSRLECRRGHSWQITDGWLVDLTGDQFEDDPDVPIKGTDVYIGRMGKFHQQFKIDRCERSCGIEYLGNSCWDRMYGLYHTILKYIDIGAD